MTDSQARPEDTENQVVRPRAPQATPPQELSIGWAFALIGLAAACLGGFMLYETFGILSGEATVWFECLNNGDFGLASCGDPLAEANTYRLGIPASTALIIGLLFSFFGPIPLVVMLNRFKNQVVTGILFFLIVIPYSVLAFTVLMLAVLIVAFYLLQLNA